MTISPNRAPPELPRGTVTFLFTDIEGSTRRWEVHGDKMVRLVERHEEILVEAVERSAGVFVKSTGDGIMAVFATADDAVRAALAGQVAIASEDWSPVPALRVRMGIHTGRCEPTGDDYFGAVVNRAARIADAGHGGQALISKASVGVLGGVDGVELVERGSCLLKDLAEPIELFQIRADGLDADLLPLRTLDPELGNLPLQRTSFVGRVDEVARSCDVLDEQRCLTLVGPGGVGKTRLALQVGAELSQHFDAGVWFVELAATPPEGDVASAILDQLVRSRAGGPARDGAAAPLEGVLQFLGAGETLVVLDNCEHVIDQSSAVANAILDACPNARVLATSREALRIPGEQVLPISPLAGVESASRTNEDVPAVRLFVERLLAAGGAPPDRTAMATIARICDLVDHLPLAIELAAGRAGHVPLEVLARRLESQHEILRGRDRTKPDRHLSMDGLLRWSYDQLRREEQVVLTRLSLFASWVDLSAVEALCGGDPVDSLDVFDHLSLLVERSLVLYDRASGRYGLLNVVRLFARAQTDDAEEAAWRSQYVAWCAELLESTAAEGREDTLARVMESYGAEIVAATTHAIAAGQQADAQRLAGRIGRWYESTGRTEAGFDLVQRALDMGPPTKTREWADAASGAAGLALALGDVDYAQLMHRAAADVFIAAGDHSAEAWARIGLATALALADDDAATEEAERARAMFDQLGDRRGVGHAHASLAVIATRSGDRDAAERHYLESLSVFRLAGARRDTASVLANLGNLSQDRDDYRRAARFFDGALQIHRELDDPRGTGLVLNNLCIVAQARGDLGRAREIANEAADSFSRVRDQRGVAAARHNLANLTALEGDGPAALEHFKAAIEGFRDARDVRGVATTLGAAIDVAARTGHEATAWRYRVDLVSMLARLGLEVSARRAIAGLVAAAHELGETELADRLLTTMKEPDPEEIERCLSVARLVEVGDTASADPEDGGDIGEHDLGSLAVLTDRELELLREVGNGKTNTELADELFISRRTVDAHLSHIRTKLGVADRSKLIVLARTHL